jgi:hypothetical protein
MGADIHRPNLYFNTIRHSEVRLMNLILASKNMQPLETLIFELVQMIDCNARNHLQMYPRIHLSGHNFVQGLQVCLAMSLGMHQT